MGGFCSKRDTKLNKPLASNTSSVGRMAKPPCRQDGRNSNFNGGMVVKGDHATEAPQQRIRAEASPGLARPSQNSPTNRELKGMVGTFIATNKEIIDAANEGSKSLQSLATRMYNERRSLNGINVATILHSSAWSPQILSSEVLIYLAECMKEHEIGAQGIGNALHGMRGVENSPASKALVAIITQKIKECSEEFNSQQIANSLYGLQSQRDSGEVRELLQALEPQITGCAEPFCSQTIGNSLYGLHSLGDSLEVKKVIRAITEKLDQLREIEETKVAVAQLPFRTGPREKGSLHAALKSKVLQGHHKLDGQAIANSVYGLQSIGDTPEVHDAIGALTFHLERVANPLKAQEVASALYGLRSQWRSSPEIEGYCAAMAKQMKRCQESFTPQHIANALFGLRWLGHSPEVQGVLRELVAKADECDESFDAQAIGNALYGLQSFGESEEMRRMLVVLRSKIDNARILLTPQENGDASCGLRAADDSPEVQAFQICDVFNGLHSLGDAEEVRTALVALTSKVRECIDTFHSSSVDGILARLKTIQAVPEVDGLITALGSISIDQAQLSK